MIVVVLTLTVLGQRGGGASIFDGNAVARCIHRDVGFFRGGGREDAAYSENEHTEGLWVGCFFSSPTLLPVVAAAPLLLSFNVLLFSRQTRQLKNCCSLATVGQ